MSDDSKEFNPIELDCEALYHELCSNLGYNIMHDFMEGIKSHFFEARKRGEYPNEKIIKKIADRLVICDKDDIDGG